MFQKLCFVFVLLLSFQLTAQDIESISKNKKEFLKLNGSLSLGSWFYNSNGIENRRTPFSWYLSGAPTLTFAGFAMPFTATISEQERSFQQPFNQIGVSPYYKWIKLHLGYRNLIFSDYTLGGATFLGTGIELTPKKFRFAAFYGRLRRSINEDTSANFTVLPSFKRIATGAKIGYGSAFNFIEFSVLNSRDVLNSAIIRESSFVKPEDNLVFGLKNQWRIFKKITFGGDGALSLITYNKYQGNIQLDSLGNDASQFAFLNQIIFVNPSTLAKLAGNAFMGYQSKKWGIKLISKYVEPDYLSHGANFIQDDILQHTINPSFSLLKQRVNLNLSAGWQRDNLDNKKRATTERLISSATVSLRPINRLMTTFSYTNFGTNQTSGVIQLNDSIRMSLVNNSFSAMMAYQIPRITKSHQFSLNAQKNNLLDRNEFTRNFTQSDILFTNLNYSIGFNKSKTNLTFGINMSDVKSFNNNIVSYGGNFVFNKSILKNKMRINTNFNYQSRMVNKVNNGYIFGNNTDIQITLKKRHSLGVGVGFLINTTSANSLRVFNEQRARINYGFSF